MILLSMSFAKKVKCELKMGNRCGNRYARSIPDEWRGRLTAWSLPAGSARVPCSTRFPYTCIGLAGHTSSDSNTTGGLAGMRAALLVLTRFVAYVAYVAFRTLRTLRTFRCVRFVAYVSLRTFRCARFVAHVSLRCVVRCANVTERCVAIRYATLRVWCQY
jgi:hypothetical protein